MGERGGNVFEGKQQPQGKSRSWLTAPCNQLSQEIGQQWQGRIGEEPSGQVLVEELSTRQHQDCHLQMLPNTKGKTGTGPR